MSNESFDHLSDVSDLSDVSFDSNQDEMEDPALTAPTKQREDVDQKKLLFSIIVFTAFFLMEASNLNKATPVTTTTINTTFDATSYRLTLRARQMQQRTKLFENQEKIARAQRVMQSKTWSKLADIPEYYWDKYIPDPTRFEGVEMYLHMTKQNGTQIEEALYFHPIEFLKGGEEGVIMISYPSLNEDFFDMSRKSCYRIEKGDLVLEHTFVMKGGQKMFVKTVYVLLVDSIL